VETLNNLLKILQICCVSEELSSVETNKIITIVFI